MKFAVLGPVEVAGDDQRHDVGGPKQRCALALLIANVGRPVSTDALIGGVYGDAAPERARRSIHTYISNLRGELGEIIERRGDGYVLTADREQIDALKFEDLVRQGAIEANPIRAGEILREALGLWRGLPYSDIEDNHRLDAEITQLNELRVTAIETRIDADLECGFDRELLAELDSLAAEYPLHERFRAQQMLALYRAGRQGEALRAFERTRSYLVEEMGLDPSSELRELEQRILNQDDSLLLARRPTVVSGAVLVADVGDPALLASLAPGERLAVVSQQATLIDQAVDSRDGHVVAQMGTAAYSWFEDASDAAWAAVELQRRTPADSPRLRAAIAVGELEITNAQNVTGPPLSRAAALVAGAHPGQIVLAESAQEAVAASGAAGLVVRSLGSHDIPGLASDELVYQLSVDGFADVFPPLRRDGRAPSLPVHERGLPGYELREQVWSSAFGVVQRAYQPSVGREVTIKIIHPEYANDPGFIRRFEIEAQMVARLEHPRIVPLLDYWRSPEGAFLVMRGMRGGTLADRLQSSLLTVAETTDLVESIGEALEYAHRNGVAHGNLNPRSVVFDDEGNPYLTDFNVAHPLDTVDNLVARDVHDLAQLVDRCIDDEESVAHLITAATARPGYATVPELLDAWREATGTGAPAATLTPTRNPYKGLRAFGEADATDFCGRDDEIRRLVETVVSQRLVAVVGPSGVGKSSVVRAGLIPALRSGAIEDSENWLVVDMIPGPYPFEELASCLTRVAIEPPADLESELCREPRGLVKAVKRYLPPGATLVLVIDQFEEVFTLVADEGQRDAFLEMIRASVLDERSHIRIVLTMRADFVHRPLGFGDFGDLFGAATVLLAAPSEEELRQMIVMPAARVGVPFEDGLVDRIAAEVKDQPGALPLLEFSLTELFEHRSTDVLTVTGYGETGGVLGALGRRAEAIYEELDSEAKEAVREIFLRLVNVAEVGRDTRRRIRRAELAHVGIGSGAVDKVLAAFGDERLLTFDRDPITRGPTVEVAHEALLTEWPRVAAWIDEHREDLVLRGRLGVAVADWETAGRSDDYLLNGGRLAQHEAWTTTTELSLSGVEQEFLEASRAAEEQRHLARRRTRRRIMASLAAVAALAVLFAGVAVIQRNRAERARLEAESRQLSAQATAQVDSDPELAVLLATEAVRKSQAADVDLAPATNVLREALAANRIVERYEGGTFVEVSPDRSLFVTGRSDGSAVVREVATGDVVAELVRDEGFAIRAGFSPNGEQIAIYYVGVEDPIWLWNRDGSQHIAMAGGSTDTEAYPALPLAFDERGELLAAWHERRDGERVEEGVYVWSTTDGSLVKSFPAHGDGQFVPGTNLLAVFDVDSDEEVIPDNAEGVLRLIDTTTWAELNPIHLDTFPGSMLAMPDGETIVLATSEAQKVEALQIPSGKPLWEATVSRPWDLAWLSDTRQVAVATEGGQVYLLDGSTGKDADVLDRGHTGSVSSVADAGSGRVLSSEWSAGGTILWDVSPTPIAEIAAVTVGSPEVRLAAFTPYPSRILVTDHTPRARLISATSGEVLHEIPEPMVDNYGMEVWSVAQGRAFTETTSRHSLLRDSSSLEVLYEAPEGMIVVNADDDLSLAVLVPANERFDPLAGGGGQIVDLATGQILSTVDWVHLPLFSPDGSLLFSFGGQIGVFETRSGRNLANLPYQSIRPMPDGRFAAVIDDEGNLWYADLEKLLDGVPLAEASQWHTFATDGNVFFNGLIPNADGSLIAVEGHTADTAKIFDTTDGTLVAELDPQLSEAPPYIFFHPDEPYVTLLSDGGRLLTYTLDVDELLQIAEDRVARSLTDAECQTFLNVATCPVHSDG